MNGLPLAYHQDPIPDGARDALFGPPDAHTQCYALLDGCKIDGLREILETSDLKHACLFQGEALQDLGDVAPWLVRLTPDAPLTRQLLTAADPKDPVPWHMWQDAPGLFLRTALDFKDLWGHLRRFTRIRTDADTWLYYRFWEPAYGPSDVLPRAGANSILSRWVFPKNSAPLTVIQPNPARDVLEVYTPAPLDATAAENRLPALTDADQAVLADLARIRHDRALQAHLIEIAPAFSVQSDHDQMEWLGKALHRAQTAGLRDTDALRNFVEAALLMGAWPDEDLAMQKTLSDHTLHECDKARLIRQDAKKRHNRR